MQQLSSVQPHFLYKCKLFKKQDLPELNFRKYRT